MAFLKALNGKRLQTKNESNNKIESIKNGELK